MEGVVIPPFGVQRCYINRLVENIRSHRVPVVENADNVRLINGRSRYRCAVPIKD